MSQIFEYTGVVEDVLPVQTFSSGFTKRDVIIGNDVDSPSKYPNPVKFSLRVAVDGRRWEGSKGVQYVVDLTGLKLEVPNADGSSTEPVPVPAEPDFPVDAGDVDDMPF